MNNRCDMQYRKSRHYNGYYTSISLSAIWSLRREFTIGAKFTEGNRNILQMVFSCFQGAHGQAFNIRGFIFILKPLFVLLFHCPTSSYFSSEADDCTTVLKSHVHMLLFTQSLQRYQIMSWRIVCQITLTTHAVLQKHDLCTTKVKSTRKSKEIKYWNLLQAYYSLFASMLNNCDCI